MMQTDYLDHFFLTRRYTGEYMVVRRKMHFIPLNSSKAFKFEANLVFYSLNAIGPHKTLQKLILLYPFNQGCGSESGF